MKESKDKQQGPVDPKSLRRSMRFKVANEVSGRIKPTMHVRILDLSQHGMLIEAPSGLPPSGMCEITVEAPSGPVAIRGRVARCQAKMVKGEDGSIQMKFHTGLEFPEELAEGLEIQDLISQICKLEGLVEESTGGFSASEANQAM